MTGCLTLNDIRLITTVKYCQYNPFIYYKTFPLKVLAAMLIVARFIISLEIIKWGVF